MNKTRRRAGRFVRNTRRAMGKRTHDKGFEISVHKMSEMTGYIYAPYIPLYFDTAEQREKWEKEHPNAKPLGESVLQKVLPDLKKLQVIEAAQEQLRR